MKYLVIGMMLFLATVQLAVSQPQTVDRTTYKEYGDQASVYDTDSGKTVKSQYNPHVDQSILYESGAAYLGDGDLVTNRVAIQGLEWFEIQFEHGAAYGEYALATPLPSGHYYSSSYVVHHWHTGGNQLDLGWGTILFKSVWQATAIGE